jgi:hypothetical protein
VNKRKASMKNRRLKVRRNDPCPCGIGKKYKGCCLHKENSKDIEADKELYFNSIAIAGVAIAY